MPFSLSYKVILVAGGAAGTIGLGTFGIYRYFQNDSIRFLLTSLGKKLLQKQRIL